MYIYIYIYVYTYLFTHLYIHSHGHSFLDAVCMDMFHISGAFSKVKLHCHFISYI